MTYGRFTMTVEEIADYLKLLGYNAVYDTEDTCNSWDIFFNEEYIGLIWDNGAGVGLIIDHSSLGNTLLNVIIKQYRLTYVKEGGYIITNSIRSRSS